ncbi:hypothetical protein [Rhizobium cremeum]|uniref:hypothetical protein n=1 Tax=Rhizobium cremeum TaxID=2813827 RepID=UPI0039E193A9
MARQALIKPGHLDKFVVAVHIWSRMKSTRANWIEGRIGSKALKYTGYFGFLEGRIPFPTRSSGAPFLSIYSFLLMAVNGSSLTSRLSDDENIARMSPSHLMVDSNPEDMHRLHVRSAADQTEG